MASKKRTALGLFVSSFLVLLAAALAALPLLPASGVALLEGTLAALPFLPDQNLELNGFGAISLLPLDGLLILTLAAYSLALFVSHTRVALIQAIAITVYGVVMILLGISLFITGIAKFTSLVTLLLAFPFGTIAYFVKYSCSDNCFADVQLIAVVAIILKLLALAVLIGASVGFAKVKGLLTLGVFTALFSICIAGLIGALSDLKFLMYPADAVLTAILGVVVLVYGIVTFVKSLFGLALAIAGQVS